MQNATITVSGPFQIRTNQRNAGLGPPASSSSSTQQPPSFPDVSASKPPPESSAKGFFRIRSSLEQSLRTATRSKKPAPLPTDEFASISPRSSKGKEKAKVVAESPRKEKPNMLRRFESKVTFLRAGREALSSSQLPPTTVARDPDDSVDRVRAAGFTSFITPSMRQGSMSSPSLHLSSQALPSPKSRPAIPASSSSNSDVLVTPTRERTKRSVVQPPRRDISPPAPLGSRREPRDSGHATTGANQSPSRHRATKSTPPVPRPLVSTPSTPGTRNERTLSPPPSPSPEYRISARRNDDLPSPPTTPTPMPKSRSQFARTPRKAAASSGHLPLNTADACSTDPHASNPIRAQLPPGTTRVVTHTQRGLSSSSASHLPLNRANPSPAPRRPSIDVQRRPSVDTTRRPSVDSPRHRSADSSRQPSAETPRPSHESPTDDRGTSPSPRPRAVSPNQRSYAQNRHFNMSTLSLSGPPNPEYRELIRTATSMLCKEIIKIPPHMSRSDSGIKDWEEVEFRTRVLARSERLWAKSGGISGGSTSNLSSIGGATSSGLSGGERERRLFCDALKDGFVLCQ